MRIPVFSLPHKHHIAIALSLIAASVYATTMNPTVSFIDSGELASVASTLGIAHPTGYPLFTILGRLATLLPLTLPVILKLNIWNLVLVASAVGMFFEFSVLLGLSSIGQRRSKKLRAELEQSLLIAAVVGALTIGLSTTVWSQSSALEVYSLHLLLLMIVSIAFVKGMEEMVEKPESGSKWFLFFLFCLGLSFANHMTTILLAPAFLYLYFSKLGLRGSSFILLVKSSPLFLLGLSVYVYLPLRSSAGPALDWGHPAEMERFLWHVSGKQYRSWIFSSFESAEKQLTYFFNHFPAEFNWLAIAVMALGLLALLRKRKELFLFLALLAAGCLAYSINYDIHDIDSYFLLAYVAVGIAIVFGLQELILKIAARSRLHSSTLLVFLVLPVLQWTNNHRNVDESDNILVSDYAQNMLASADSNAVILTYQWDYFVSASYYEQHVLGRRPDVVVIDKELLRRSWYFLQLERNYPWLLEQSKERVAVFLRELWKFEHDLPYDGSVIESAYDGMINDMLFKASESRPVYLGPEIEPQFGPGFQRIPEGLLLRLVPPGQPAVARQVPIRFRPAEFRNRLTSGLIQQYLRMFTFHAVFIKNRGDADSALYWLDRVREIDPSFPPAEALKLEMGRPLQ